MKEKVVGIPKKNRLQPQRLQPVDILCEMSYLLKRSRSVFIMSCVMESRS